jgi:hypothetical protein
MKQVALLPARARRTRLNFPQSRDPRRFGIIPLILREHQRIISGGQVGQLNVGLGEADGARTQSEELYMTWRGTDSDRRRIERRGCGRLGCRGAGCRMIGDNQYWPTAVPAELW